MSLSQVEINDLVNKAIASCKAYNVDSVTLQAACSMKPRSGYTSLFSGIWKYSHHFDCCRKYENFRINDTHKGHHKKAKCTLHLLIRPVLICNHSCSDCSPLSSTSNATQHAKLTHVHECLTNPNIRCTYSKPEALQKAVKKIKVACEGELNQISSAELNVDNPFFRTSVFDSFFVETCRMIFEKTDESKETFENNEFLLKFADLDVSHSWRKTLEDTIFRKICSLTGLNENLFRLSNCCFVRTNKTPIPIRAESCIDFHVAHIALGETTSLSFFNGFTRVQTLPKIPLVDEFKRIVDFAVKDFVRNSWSQLLNNQVAGSMTPLCVNQLPAGTVQVFKSNCIYSRRASEASELGIRAFVVPKSVAADVSFVLDAGSVVDALDGRGSIPWLHLVKKHVSFLHRYPRVQWILRQDVLEAEKQRAIKEIVNEWVNEFKTAGLKDLNQRDEAISWDSLVFFGDFREGMGNPVLPLDWMGDMTEQCSVNYAEEEKQWVDGILKKGSSMKLE